MSDIKKLKKDLKYSKTQLLTLCNDKIFAKKLIDKMLVTKGMMSIEPTLVHVPASNIVGEIKHSAYNIIQTKEQHIVYKIAGISIVITPRLNIYNIFQALIFQKNISLFAELDMSLYDTEEKVEKADLYLGVKEIISEINNGLINREEVLESFDEEYYRALLEHCALIPQGILLAFENGKSMNKMYNFILDNINEMLEEATDESNLPVDDASILPDMKDRLDLADKIDAIKPPTIDE